MVLDDRFAESGSLQLEGVFDRQLIDSVHAEYQQQVQALRTAGPSAEYVHVARKRMIFPIKLQGPLLSPDLYANPILLSIIGNILGDNFVIDSFTCVTAFPGAPEQPHHTDHPDLFPEEPGLRAALKPYAITLAIPLIDLTEETGTTKLLPFSHRLETMVEKPILPLVPRGGCFLMDYRLAHHGTANLGQCDRPILYIVYARSWFTDTKNFREFARIRVNAAELTRIPSQFTPLFRRIAARGAHNSTEAALFRGH